MIASSTCEKLIIAFESLHDGDLTLIGLQPKMCPSGIWTEGYGHVIYDNGRALKGIENKEKAYKLSIVKDEAHALELLRKDIALYNVLLPKLGVTFKQNQFDALVSFAFNCGYNGLKESTLLRYIRYKMTALDIETQFMRWVKGSDGKPLPGLVRRRRSEAHLYNTGELNFFEK